jgi:hypothetical protein
MNSKNLPLSHADGGWTIGVGWTRKVVIVASVLNILALLTIILSIINLTPLTLIISVSIGGGLMAISIILYIIVVVTDLRRRGVL